jgi:hypothetical protein
MRTTLTLDDDVAVQVERLRAARKTNLKRIVNDGLRHGLRIMEATKARGKSFRTRDVSLGRCLLPTIDDVSEALAIAEGESHR